MALTDNPYLPLYVKDWLTDNDLKMCSPHAHGILINIMLIMHKENPYGTLLLDEMLSKSGEAVKDFASHLARLLPFSESDICLGLTELLGRRRLAIEKFKGKDYLTCKKMIELNNLNVIKASAGKKGAEKRKEIYTVASAAALAETVANSGIVIENENGIENINKEEAGIKNFIPPTIDSIISYFDQNFVPEEEANNFFDHYNSLDWKSGNTQITSWKDKAAIWIRKYKSDPKKNSRNTTNIKDITKKAAEDTIKRLKGQ